MSLVLGYVAGICNSNNVVLGTKCEIWNGTDIKPLNKDYDGTEMQIHWCVSLFIMHII